jgi:hypothetical protein
MPTSIIAGMTIPPGGRTNLALSDLALNAAIELERFQSSSEGNLEALVALANALSENSFIDLTLVPVYDRALANAGASTVSSKSDLYSKLHAIASKLQSTETATPADLDLLRDFCVALHDALLTSRLQTVRQPVLGQRRII